ncbi:MAG: UvrB/UvrC motif-containing protein [Thermoguttaceae bacterium]
MKCQKCERPASFHITELTGNKPHELHLCEEHARSYLNGSGELAETTSELVATLSQNMTEQVSLSQASEELKGIDQKTCPICGITFFDFRTRGRLGCPNDYVCFDEQLSPLILSIHGSVEHVGKSPLRVGKAEDERIILIRLRKELEEAISKEEYEKASEIRDKIRSIPLE